MSNELLHHCFSTNYNEQFSLQIKPFTVLFCCFLYTGHKDSQWRLRLRAECLQKNHKITMAFITMINPFSYVTNLIKTCNEKYVVVKRIILKWHFYSQTGNATYFTASISILTFFCQITYWTCCMKPLRNFPTASPMFWIYDIDMPWTCELMRMPRSLPTLLQIDAACYIDHYYS